MKKLLLINAIVLTMAACGGSNDKPSTPATSSAATTSSSSVAVSSSSKPASVSSAASSDTLNPPQNVNSSISNSTSVASSVSSVASSASSAYISQETWNPNASSSASSISSSASSTSSSASSQSSAASSASSSTGWKLVWSDDFDGTAIDPAKWGFEENCWGGGNNEQQCYTNKADNAFVAGGNLNIVVKEESFTGANSPDGTGSATATLPYTSARLRTKNLKEWTYGRFEIRAKLPSGQGSWPAIWMLPTNSPYGTWASSGEIDIMEAVNLKTPTDEANVGNIPEARVYGTLHYGRNWPDNKSSGEPYKLPGGLNPADGFHTYALEWEEGEIRWYVDGVHYQTQRKAGWYSQYLSSNVLVNAPDGAPFDDKAQYHMLLNVAVGGAWAGNVNGKRIDTNIFPLTMQVDYVKVYECTASPSTGKGCATVDAGAKVNPGNVRPSLNVFTTTLPTTNLYIDEPATGLTIDRYTPGNINATEESETGRGKILTIDKLSSAAGNAYFTIGSGKSNFKPWLANGELVFDVRLNSKATGSKLFVKLDSGWPNVSDYEVTLPAVGVWQEIRIPVATIVNHGNTYSVGNKVDLTAITNALVFEPTDQMNVSFDNIRLEGGAAVPVDVPLTSSFDIFVEDVDGRWDLGAIKWDENGSHVVVSKIDSGDSAHGNVIDVLFKNDGKNGLAYIQSSTTKDATAFASTGYVSFDVKVLDYGTNTSGLIIKADCVDPCSSGDMVLGKIADGVWETHTILVSQLVAGSGGKHLDLSKLNTPFAILPTWGDQAGVHLQLDNIKWIKP